MARAPRRWTAPFIVTLSLPAMAACGNGPPVHTNPPANDEPPKGAGDSGVAAPESSVVAIPQPSGTASPPIASAAPSTAPTSPPTADLPAANPGANVSVGADGTCWEQWPARAQPPCAPGKKCKPIFYNPPPPRRVKCP